jgi:flagellin
VTRTEIDADGNKITYSYTTKEMWIQSGDFEANGMMLKKEWLTRTNIGLDRVSVGDYESASASITVCDKALERVDAARAAMGAYMNRLEHAVNVNENTSENIQNSESKIRDTDMASEMVEYSKSNILAQAGQAMLAQANQNTQGILELLR